MDIDTERDIDMDVERDVDVDVKSDMDVDVDYTVITFTIYKNLQSRDSN